MILLQSPFFQSVEERRTYKDSTGREEVTVTELEPGAAGTLLPLQGEGVDLLHPWTG